MLGSFTSPTSLGLPSVKDSIISADLEMAFKIPVDSPQRPQPKTGHAMDINSGVQSHPSRGRSEVRSGNKKTQESQNPCLL